MASELTATIATTASLSDLCLLPYIINTKDTVIVIINIIGRFVVIFRMLAIAAAQNEVLDKLSPIKEYFFKTNTVPINDAHSEIRMPARSAF